MEIRITDTSDAKTVSLRLWRGGWNAGYEPDCAEDILDGGNIGHDEDGERVMTAAEFNALCRWWNDEVRHANAGEDGEGLMGLTDEEIDNGDEWVLDID